MIFFLLLATLIPSAHATSLSSDRILLSTRLGKIAIALYDQDASVHAEQIRTLAKAGVFDTTHFFRVRKEFYIQLSGVDERRIPISTEQRKLLKKLPGEFHPVSHARGTVTMARDMDNPNSAESSFLILVEDFPALNEKYTAIGVVTHGMKTVERIRQSELDTHDRPLHRIEIKATWIPSVETLPADIEEFSPTSSDPSEKLPRFFPFLMGLLLLGPIFLFIPAFRDRRGWWTVGNLSLLVGGFAVFVYLTPMASDSQWIGLLLLMGSISLFWRMGKFERQT